MSNYKSSKLQKPQLKEKRKKEEVSDAKGKKHFQKRDMYLFRNVVFSAQNVGFTLQIIHILYQQVGRSSQILYVDFILPLHQILETYVTPLDLFDDFRQFSDYKLHYS